MGMLRYCFLERLAEQIKGQRTFATRVKTKLLPGIRCCISKKEDFSIQIVTVSPG